jgi:predicted phosphodiesterase
MDKKIVDIGKLKGKVLLFGGAYSNLQALQALMNEARKNGIMPEQCISTGDLIGYCSQPEECIKLFRDWGARSIAGNVELQLKNDAEDCGCDFQSGSTCDNLSKIWYPYARSRLSTSSLDFIATLPNNITFQYAGRKVTVLHGSFNKVSEFIFKSTPWAIKQSEFELTQSDMIVAGHSGLPFVQQKADQLWLNSGVIGMPANDGKPWVWYVILNEEKEFEFAYHNLSYDHITASTLMLQHHLPKTYAETLITGYWDNMDILPDEEKALRGHEMTF